jgi:hypothetical protein
MMDMPTSNHDQSKTLYGNMPSDGIAAVGLEVVPPSHSHSSYYSAPSPKPEPGAFYTASGKLYPHLAPTLATKKIWGFERTTFILSVVLALVVIIAAVGGGVGGTIMVNNARA